MTSGRAAVQAIEKVEGAYTPFPGGLVGSGSKPSSRYKGLFASTNERYCPTIRAKISDTEVPDGSEFALEIVVNGLTEESVGTAMAAAIREICNYDDVLKVTAGNFDGKLGKYQIYLHDVLSRL